MTASAMLRDLLFDEEVPKDMARSALYDRCTCGHFDHEHAAGRRCTVCTCNHFDWDIDADEEASKASAAQPPPVLCTVCMDSGTEFTEEGPQPCTNRIHEEVKDG